MFRSAAQIDSERTANKIRKIKANWESTSDNWFDGSVDSIDRRIGMCNRLINQARQATSRLIQSSESVHYMKLASDLMEDQQALSQMRRDLLTAAADREAGGHNIGGIPDKYNDDYGPLPDQDTLRQQIWDDEHSGDDEAESADVQNILNYWELENRDPYGAPPRRRHTSSRTASYVDDLYQSGLNNPDRGIRERFEQGHWPRRDKEEADEEFEIVPWEEEEFNV